MRGNVFVLLISTLLILFSFGSAAAAPTYPTPAPLSVTTPTLYVAASDSTAPEKAAANYICDGVNDQVEIQNAMNVVGAGGTVVLDSGHFYPKTTAITTPANIQLLGKGVDVTVLNFTSNSFLDIANNGVTVGNFNVIGTGYTFSWYYGVIRVKDASHIRLDSIKGTSDGSLQALYFFYTESGTMQDIRVNNVVATSSGTYEFLFASHAANPLIKDVVLWDCQALNAGIGPAGSRFNDWVTGFDFAETNDIQNLTAIRCIADGSWESGFHFEGPPIKQDVTLIDCISRNNGQAKKVQSFSSLYWGAGYLLSGPGITAQNCISEKNYIGYDVTGGGVTVTGSSDNCSDRPVYNDGKTTYPGITIGCGVTTPTPTATPTPTPTPTPVPNRAPVLAAIGARSVNEGATLSFTVSATDPDGNPLTYSTGALPSGASFNAGTRNFAWTPTYSQAGSYQVTFSVTDGTLSDSETITITVNNVNSAPVLAAIGAKAVGEGSPLNFAVSATDPEGDSLTYSTGALPSGATFTAGTRTFSWTPTYSQAGTYQVTFTVSDGSLTDSETITITVNNVNRAPVLAAIGAKSVATSSPLTFPISATDPDGDALTYSTGALPSGASFNTGTRTFSWTPTSGQAGTYQVTFSASDSSLTDSETITITVNNVNGAPVLASIGSKSVNEGSLLSFAISATDPDGNPLTYSTGALPSGATFTAGTRTFSWTPTYSQAGAYQVTFSVSDGSLSDSETITITVNNVNRAPVLTAIGPKSISEGTLLSFTISATDPDGDALTYSTSALPSGATFNAGTRTFSWTPTFGQAGSYQITFSASDGLLSASEAVTITVRNVNRAPVLTAIGNKSVNEAATLSFTVSATDPDGDVLTNSTSALPSGASFNTVTRAFSWTPTYAQAGKYPVTFTVSDGSLSASETITITVNNVNRPPVLTAIGPKTVTEGSPLTFTISGSDPDGDSLTFFTSALPSGASFNSGTKTFSWTPAVGQAGTYQVTFAVTDGMLSTSDTITITVNHVNQPPVLAAIGSKTVNEASTLAFSVSATDPDGDPLTYSTGSLPSGASFNAGSRTFSWTPAYKTAGSYQVAFSVSDGSLGDGETVPITVNHVNRPPSHPRMGPKNVKEGSTLTFSVSASDPDGDPITYSTSALPGGASFTASTGTFTWTPSYTQAGTYGVTFSATDGSLADTETVPITVEDAPAPTPTPVICIGPCPTPEPSLSPTPTPASSLTPTPTLTPVPTTTTVTEPTPTPTSSSSPQPSQTPEVPESSQPASRSPSPPAAGMDLIEDPTYQSMQNDGTGALSFLQMNTEENALESGQAGLSGSKGSAALLYSSANSGNAGADSLITGDTLGSTIDQSQSEDATNPFPSFGVHSALIFGSTVTVSSIVKKKEGPFEFERLIHYLLTGVAIFTMGIIVFLVGMIL